jgi:hypothetical protein
MTIKTDSQFLIGDAPTLHDLIRADMRIERDRTTGRTYLEIASPYYYADCEGSDAPARIEAFVDGWHIELVRDLDLSSGQTVAYRVDL